MPYQLGRYEILEEIGSGGFATVFRARDTVLNREVAVKIMRPLLMSDAGFVARFEREAQVAANLEHPHIIPIHDYGEENGRLYLVMKWVRQGSLEKRLESGPLSFEETLTISRQIATALDYAHQRQIIHRDIKPDNVLLGNNDHVYLADFGLVKALQQSSLTASLSGGILGTPAYTAPEVWQGQAATPETDVYALACLLFEMVVGRPLFAAPTPPATMHLHFQPPSFPDQWPADVPAGFGAILRQALAQAPGERYASAGVLVQALQSLKPADPLAKAYATLQATMQREAWAEAVTQAGDILAQDPLYRDVPALLRQALAGKAEAERVEKVKHEQQKALDTPASRQPQAQVQTAVVASSKTEPLAQDNKNPKTAPLRQSGALKQGKRQYWWWALAGIIMLVMCCGVFFISSEIQSQQARATRQAQIQATRQAQVQAVATLTAQANLQAGPRSGTLTHREGAISSTWADVERQNFIAEVTFTNPYPLSAGQWDYGFLFRHEGRNQQMRLIINSNRAWRLYNHTGEESQYLGGGSVANLNTAVDGRNTIRLIVYDEQGWLYVNDQFVAELDLSARTNAGDVSAATGITVGYEIVGETVRYEEFRVWSLP